MNTHLFFRPLCLCLTVLSVSGCVSGNLVSSNGFELYVSEKRYLNETCSVLGEMYTNLQAEDRIDYARLYTGLDDYPHPIAPKYERQLANSNLRAIVKAIQRKC